MTPEEILARAAEDIAQHGHAKEQFYEANPTKEGAWQTAPACAYGALSRVAGTTSGNGTAMVYDGRHSYPELHAAADKLAAQIRASRPEFADADTYYTITHFNDDDRTTGEDVILAMKDAAHGVIMKEIDHG